MRVARNRGPGVTVEQVATDFEVHPMTLWQWMRRADIDAAAKPQGRHHTQALLCLARRRADVLFAMLRDGTFYEPQPVRAVTPQT